MKCILWFSAAILLMANMGHGVRDKAFCNANKPSGTDEAAPDPAMITDGSVFMEETSQKGKYVVGESIHVSRTYQKVKFRRYTRGKESRFYAILGNKKDLLIENDFLTGKPSNCTSKPLDGSSIAHEYNILDANNKITFSGLESMLSFTTRTPYSFVGGSRVRGIPANEWYVCLWQKESDRTLATHVYYSDNYNMPSNKGNALLRVRQIIKDPKGVQSTVTHDYFKYDDSLPSSYSEFDLPLDMYCKDRPVALNLPKMNFQFQYKMIQENLGNTNLPTRETPRLEYHKETYDNLLKLFLDQQQTVGDNKLQTLRKLLLQDFTTGLQFDVDQSAGSCTITKIETFSEAFIKNKDNTVTMKKPQQFFDLDSMTYHYMGKHHSYDRQIETDVYKSVVTKGGESTTTILYFATKNWMTKVMGFSAYFVMPIRMKIIKGVGTHITKTEVEFYQFTRRFQISDEHPKIKSCFSQGQQMALEVQTDLPFTMLHGGFSIALLFEYFVDNLLTKSNLVSTLRVNNLQATIGPQGNVLITFTLLDYSKHIMNGDAYNQLYNLASNDAIYNNLTSLINAGNLAFTMKGKLLNIKVKALGMTKGILNPNSFENRRAIASYTSQTFSSGAMGGLAVGILVLGLLIGFAVFTIVKKVRTPVPDISMQTLGEPVH